MSMKKFIMKFIMSPVYSMKFSQNAFIVFAFSLNKADAGTDWITVNRGFLQGYPLLFVSCIGRIIVCNKNEDVFLKN